MRNHTLRDNHVHVPTFEFHNAFTAVCVHVCMYDIVQLYVCIQLSDSAFCTGLSRMEVPEQALEGISLGLGLAMKIKSTEFSCMCILSRMGTGL